MNTDKQTVYDVLDAAPDCARAVAWLANWSFSESNQTGTAWLEFLDLTGISYDRYGEKVNRHGYIPRPLEADYLGQALIEWADRPIDVEAYVSAIMEADN